jgi:hypothetical protein
MGEHSDRPPDDWGDVVARWTFISSVVLAVLYVGSIFVFILSR